VHSEPHLGPSPHALEEGPVREGGRLPEDAFEIPDRLVVVNAEAEGQ
jgi:hypothetical protein